VCPNDAISIDEEMNVAVIDPDKCIGCGLCVKECPRGIIQLVPANANIVYLCSYESFKNIPGREKCDKGCLHCKKCFRACENGAIIWNEEKAIPEFDFTRCTLCGKCIEVCPHDRLIELSNVALKEKVGIPKGKDIMIINSYSFGSITIDGKNYRSDVIIFPDKINSRWWRKSGHLLSDEDIGEILKYKPEMLIIGTGTSGLMMVDQKVKDKLNSLGIRFIIKKTAEAVEQYNKLEKKDKVVCAFHLTC
ncbi:unnamed protein product, partial [marine sediment metagenome]